MPTYGWVQETAEERFYERGRSVVPAPIEYRCPVCSAVFFDPDSRSWHVGVAHPIERPILLIHSKASPSTLLLRSSVSPTEITVLNCTKALVSRNGSAEQLIDPAKIGTAVASEEDAGYRLRLFNERAEDEAKIEADYTLRIAIALPEELSAIDRLFVEYLAIDDLSMREVNRFARDAQSYGGARFYTDALVAYGIGVLVKEGTASSGATLPFSEFQGKFMHALSELRLFRSRPVATAVESCIRLNLNDFSTSRPASGILALDHCLGFFMRLSANHELSFPPQVDLGRGEIPICPVDRDTHTVISGFASLCRRDRDSSVSKNLEERAADAALSPFDRAKLAALSAAERIRAGEIAHAYPTLHALANDPQFGAWAQGELEKADAE